ncbi:MAG: TlpA family protein disulfide reductase [Sphingobacteriaceae bacterium]|nr:TlpA family protein disulfide reductase [Sphingobacteriaceae bacterium]
MKSIIKKYASNTVFIALIIALLFVPDAKALVIQGLMKVGFFSPNLKTKPITIDDDITFKNAKGEVLSLNSLKDKVVFVNFWATWCGPCVGEMPSINEFYNRFKNDPKVAFVFVDADSDLPKSQGFLDKKGYAFPLYKLNSNISTDLYKGILPTTFVLNKEGTVVFREEGAADYSTERFANFINALKD